MKIFTIVVIYNGMHNNWIEKCFDSIYNSSVLSEIIAIDNCSTDNSTDYIRKNYPNVHLVANKSNKGFGGANNQGLKIALKKGGDYFFLLNQDAVVEKNTIEELINISLKNTEYLVISPIHRNGTGNRLDFSFSLSVTPYYCPEFYSDFVINVQKKTIYESNFICAAAWLLTKKCLEVVGGFNPAFFHYGEDDNYCHRVLYHGGKVGLVPTAFINHDREYRSKSKYDKDIEFIKRKYFLIASNPLDYKTIDILLKQFKNKKLKFWITRNKRAYNEAKEIYDYLFINKEIIKQCALQSLNRNEYIFLK